MKDSNHSRQMYLKTIWMLESAGKRVRHVDIARTLGYTKPSVTNAVHKLVAEGLAMTDSQNSISLTAAGREIAEALMDRYHVLHDFLLSLGVQKEAAEENACLMEHLITDELFSVMQGILLQNRAVSLEEHTAESPLGPGLPSTGCNA